MRDTGCGIRDTGYGMRDTGCGIRDARFESRIPHRGSELGEFEDVHERRIGIGNNVSKGKRMYGIKQTWFMGTVLAGCGCFCSFSLFTSISQRACSFVYIRVSL